MAITVQNLLSGETRSTADVDKIVWYLLHQDNWAIIVPSADPGA
jgi:hypothetical protein